VVFYCLLALLYQDTFCSVYILPLSRTARQIPDPDSETFTEPPSIPVAVAPGLGADSTLLLEAEIAKRIRQGESSDLSPVETNTVLRGLAGSREVIRKLAGARDPILGLAGARNPLLALAGTRNPLLGLPLPGRAGVLARRKLIADILRRRLLLNANDGRKGLIDQITALDDPLDDPVDTLADERRKVLKEIYGFDPFGTTLGDDVELDVDTRNLIDQIYGLDSTGSVGSASADRTLLKSLIQELRLRRIRNQINRNRFGLRRNPFVIRDIVG